MVYYPPSLMKALVTGGAGFIGSHLATRLAFEGHDVVVFDNLTSGKRENLAHIPPSKVDLVVGDVRDAALLESTMKGAELVFHQAAIVSVPYSVEHPQETHDVNIQGTLNVLMAAKAVRARRVVFACSAAVYGDEAETPNVETMRAAPVSPYGIEKLTGEQYLAVWNKLYGVETVSLRYFNVFGERQDPKSPYSGVISIFVDRALTGRGVTMFGDGGQTRDFVYVGNVVDANMRAALTPGVGGRSYNVGCGGRTTLLEMLAMIERITGKTIERSHEPARAGDIRDSFAAIDKIRRELGYEPTVGVEEGLTRLIRSLR